MICFSDIGGTASYATYIRANFAYQSSNPKSVIFKVLQFSETVLTVDEGMPSGALTSTSSFNCTLAPSTCIRCRMISSTYAPKGHTQHPRFAFQSRLWRCFR